MDPATDTSRLKRQLYDMPDDIRDALKNRALTNAYAARPAYDDLIQGVSGMVKMVATGNIPNDKGILSINRPRGRIAAVSRRVRSLYGTSL